MTVGSSHNQHAGKTSSVLARDWTQTLIRFTFHVGSILGVLPHSQVVGLSGLPPQQVSDPLIVDLQVAEGTDTNMKPAFAACHSIS